MHRQYVCIHTVHTHSKSTMQANVKCFSFQLQMKLMTPNACYDACMQIKNIIQASVTWFILCVCVCIEQVLSLPGLSSNITAVRSLVQMWQVLFHRSPRKVPQPNGKHDQNSNTHGNRCDHSQRPTFIIFAFISKEHFLSCRATC